MSRWYWTRIGIESGYPDAEAAEQRIRKLLENMICILKKISSATLTTVRELVLDHGSDRAVARVVGVGVELARSIPLPGAGGPADAIEAAGMGRAMRGKCPCIIAAW